MPAPLALALVCVLAATPGEAPPKDGGSARPSGTGALPAPPAAIRALIDSAAAAEVVVLEVEGQLDVERVRRRLGALETLEGSARPTLRRGPVQERLHADRILALALLRFAAELEAARPPRAARGTAAGPWHEQLEATLRRARWRAAAHLRSCRDLADGPAHAALRKTCAEDLARLASSLGESVAAETPRGEPGVRAIRAARLPELQACFDDWAADHPAGAERLAFTAQLEVGEAGRVSAVALTPPDARRAALDDCLADALWLWAFPGLEEAEVELPLSLEHRASDAVSPRDVSPPKAPAGGGG